MIMPPTIDEYLHKTDIDGLERIAKYQFKEIVLKHIKTKFESLENYWELIVIAFYPNSNKVFNARLICRRPSCDEVKIWCDLNGIKIDKIIDE